MKIEVRLIPDLQRDSPEEIQAEISILEEILGSQMVPTSESVGGPISGYTEKRMALWTGDFWELYGRIKDRIYRRLEVQK
jgi:hypothetical protein